MRAITNSKPVVRVTLALALIAFVFPRAVDVMVNVA